MISVIVPVYQVEPYLPQCLDSILRQTYRDIEILLIDDGSPDKCGEICDEYAKEDSRIRVFHTENKGLSAARNLGLREAKGEYIGFVDSDDWIEPDMYEILLRRMEETGTNISACAERVEYRNHKCDNCIDEAVYTGKETIRTLLSKLGNTVWNKLYKKDCWTDIFFPENHAYEEIATSFKVFLKADSLSCVATPLYHYRMREGSIVHSPSMNNLMDFWNAYYARHIFFSTHPEFNRDQITIDFLDKQIAFASIRTWRWIYKVPKKQRDYDFLYKVSGFVQKQFPLFGKKNWELYLRAGIFFSRYTNEASFAALYAMIAIFNFFAKWNKRPFPSCSHGDSL